MAAADVETLVEAARKAQSSGRLVEAEALYLEALEHKPHDFDITQALAFLAFQLGRIEIAAERFRAAVELRPDLASARCNLGIALRQLGRLDEALSEYEIAVSLKPNDHVAWSNRGGVLRGLGRPEEAIQSFDRALSLVENFAEAWLNKGNALVSLNKYDDAVESYSRAIGINNNLFDAHIRRAAALQAVRRYDDALSGVDIFLSLVPNSAEGWAIRASILYAVKNYKEAVESYDRAIAAGSASSLVYFNRGMAQFSLGMWEGAIKDFNKSEGQYVGSSIYWNHKAIAFYKIGMLDHSIDSYNKAIDIDPESESSYLNKSLALMALGRSEEAAQSADKALALSPTAALPWSVRGMALHALGRYSEAIASYARAIEIKSDYPEAQFNRSVVLLLLEEFDTGWLGYEQRKWRDSPSGNRSYSNPTLSDPLSSKGKVVLVYSEQGFGDTIQFCRYLTMLEYIGAKVLFAPQKRIGTLMRSLSPTIEIVDADDPTLQFDYHNSLMSLPFIFKTRLDTIPAKVPYLSVEPERIARWRERIGENGFRIGVSWRGRGGRISLERSFAPDMFAAISAVPGVRLISLQKGDGESELSAFPDLKIEQLAGLDEGPDAFLDSAAAMHSLDLVISSDTALVHLAGAFARPIWVPLKYVPDWRWLLNRSDTPWYPTMRLFRQQTFGDWAPAFSDMEAMLREQLNLQASGAK